MDISPFVFRSDTLKLLDQRKLPNKVTWIRCRDAKKVYWSIQHMVVRGAPAIGVAGGYGLYLGVRSYQGDRKAFLRRLEEQAKYLKSARPTGVNLRNVIDEIVARVKAVRHGTVKDLKARLLHEAKRFHKEDIELCRSIGRHGSRLFRSGDHVLTHCNAGGLATTGYGTALGVLYACKERGKKLTVYADETRPLLQGARLTAWELVRMGLKCRLLCDNAAASLMQAGTIDGIVVGADRIASNGDTANKIGTYNLALLAKAHGIPFYIAAPSTTFDFSIRSGKQIPIENRHATEVTMGMGRQIAPKGVGVINPAFDVTPHSLISAFITEKGVLRRPFQKSFSTLRKK